jgi:hypothetical protein
MGSAVKNFVFGYFIIKCQTVKIRIKTLNSTFVF